MIRKHHAKYDQARKVAERFGGPAALAAALGYHRATVYKWMMPRSDYRGGTDGVIPTRTLLTIRNIARGEGIYLADADLALTLTQKDSP
jgi:hypothetical protein